MFFIRFLQRRRNPSVPFLKIIRTNKTYTGEVVTLLESKGYTVICDKLRIPIIIQVEEKQLESRLYADYIVEKNSEIYVVKIGKKKQALSMTGAAIREHLLHYYLLYRPQGIIYVSDDKKDLKIIQFAIDEENIPQTRGHLKSALFWFVLGVLVTFIFLK